MEKKSQLTRFAIYLILLLPLLMMRDITVRNELKYLSIADESLSDGHFWTMYNQGEAYADKPPLYNWIIMGLRLLFGRHVVFAIELFSLIPALVTIGIFNRWCGNELKGKFAYASELALLTTAWFLGAAIVVRMDMLMVMFITLTMWTFYRMFTGDGRLRLRILFPVYMFLAIFSKGPVGIMVPLFCIPVWLLCCRKIKDFLHYWNWRTWLILAGLCAVWFGCAYLEGGGEYMENLLIRQTVGRAVNAAEHNWPFYYYGYTIWYAMAPWSILILGVIIYGFVKKVRMSALTRFMVITGISIVVMMSLFSSKLAVYILPAFPFLTYGAFLILQDLGLPRFGEISRKVVVCGGQTIMALVFVGGCFIRPFNDRIGGYRDTCRKAMDEASELGIDRYGFYRIKNGAGLDVYLGQDPVEVTQEQFDNPQSLLTDGNTGIIIFYNENGKSTYKAVTASNIL